MYLSSLSLALNRPGAVSLEQVVASLFAAGEQGAWYDPSAANVTWRRNLLTYTEQFDNAAWRTLLVSVSANSTTAPNGTSTAETISVTAGNNFHNIATRPSITSGVCTFSCYAKVQSGMDYLGLITYDGSGIRTTSFNIATGQKGTVAATHTADIQSVGNGWYRCIITFHIVGAWFVAGEGVYINPQFADNTPSYNDSGSGSGIYIWGAQIEAGTTATPYQRIVTPEITYLADVQSQPLLFQDSTGATPVTAVEQPVGLILDKRKGLVLGPELVTGAASAYPNSTIATVGDTVTATCSTNGTYGIRWATGAVATAGWVKMTVEIVTNGAARSVVLFPNLINAGVNVGTTVGNKVCHTLVAATSGSNADTAILIQGGVAGETFSVRLASVKYLDGNHAYQTGSTARPVLRARYNLLTYSEQFNDASWQKLAAGTGVAPVVTANAGTAPDGTTTADRVVLDRGAGTTSSDVTRLFQSATAPASGTSVFSVWMRSYDGSSSYTVRLVCGNGTSNVTVTPTWTRFSVVSTDTSTNAQIRLQGDQTQQTADILAWGGHINYGTSAGDYQRIAAATDYATTSTITGQPFRPYLFFDGTDDQMKTVGFGSTVMDMFTGYFIDGSKTTTNVFQFSVDLTRYGPTAESGSAASTNQNIGTVTFRSNGAAETFTDRNNAYTKTSNKLQVFGTQSINPSAWTETILFAYPSPPSLGLKGNVYGHIIRQSLSASERATVETYLAGKTGVTL